MATFSTPTLSRRAAHLAITPMMATVPGKLDSDRCIALVASAALTGNIYGGAASATPITPRRTGGYCDTEPDISVISTSAPLAGTNGPPAD
eukprot:COSAG02_NODE_5007_length_4726_cov_8.568619_2_plen_91_part_00